jgi:hypothetical protein
MATKADLLTTLVGYITAIVTVAKHRNADQAIVDEMYREPILETQSSPTFTIPDNASTKLYSLNLKKTGNVVTVSGYFQNSTGSTATGSDWLTLTGEYTPKTGIGQSFLLCAGSTLVICEVTSGGKMRIIGSFPTSSFTIPSFSYITNA